MMCRHETKSCPRCGALFECKPGNIVQCRCYGIELSAEQRVYIDQRYSDCMCGECLKHLSNELNLLKEKYIFR